MVPVKSVIYVDAHDLHNYTQVKSPVFCVVFQIIANCFLLVDDAQREVDNDHHRRRHFISQQQKSSKTTTLSSVFRDIKEYIFL